MRKRKSTLIPALLKPCPCHMTSLILWITSDSPRLCSSDPQTVVPGNRNNAMLQNLLPDTAYNITVEAVYAEGPGGTLNGNGRTGEAASD